MKAKLVRESLNLKPKSKKEFEGQLKKLSDKQLFSELIKNPDIFDNNTIIEILNNRFSNTPETMISQLMKNQNMKYNEKNFFNIFNLLRIRKKIGNYANQISWMDPKFLLKNYSNRHLLLASIHRHNEDIVDFLFKNNKIKISKGLIDYLKTNLFDKQHLLKKILTKYNLEEYKPILKDIPMEELMPQYLAAEKELKDNGYNITTTERQRKNGTISIEKILEDNDEDNYINLIYRNPSLIIYKRGAIRFNNSQHNIYDNPNTTYEDMVKFIVENKILK